MQKLFLLDGKYEISCYFDQNLTTSGCVLQKVKNFLQ